MDDECRRRLAALLKEQVSALVRAVGGDNVEAMRQAAGELEATVDAHWQTIGRFPRYAVAAIVDARMASFTTVFPLEAESVVEACVEVLLAARDRLVDMAGAASEPLFPRTEADEAPVGAEGDA